MALVIEVEPEIEDAVRTLAAREGLDPDRYVKHILEEWVKERAPLESHPSLSEAELLREIRKGLPPETWQRYHELNAARRAETLTAEDQKELIGLIDVVEQWNARRITLLAELSRRRGVSISDLMKELGLGAPPYA